MSVSEGDFLLRAGCCCRHAASASFAALPSLAAAAPVGPPTHSLTHPLAGPRWARTRCPAWQTCSASSWCVPAASRRQRTRQGPLRAEPGLCSVVQRPETATPPAPVNVCLPPHSLTQLLRPAKPGAKSRLCVLGKKRLPSARRHEVHGGVRGGSSEAVPGRGRAHWRAAAAAGSAPGETIDSPC